MNQYRETSGIFLDNPRFTSSNFSPVRLGQMAQHFFEVKILQKLLSLKILKINVFHKILLVLISHHGPSSIGPMLARLKIELVEGGRRGGWRVIQMGQTLLMFSGF
jgi:hypothetical protein